MKRRAFITGASRGIGNAVLKRFRGAGIETLAPSRQDLDLASPESLRRYLSRHDRLHVDILVNNAAENRIYPIEDISLEDWQRTMTVNLTSAFLLIQSFAPRMAARKWGRIVNISSCYSFLGKPGRAAYTASKAGLNGITRTAAVEYGSHNVLVNAVCPGFVDTEMTRRNNTAQKIDRLRRQTVLKRLAAPDEIAEFVYFLASEKNTYVTGQTLVIDGGFSCQ